VFTGIVALIFPIIIIGFFGWFISQISIIEHNLHSIDKTLKLILENLQKKES